MTSNNLCEHSACTLRSHNYPPLSCHCRRQQGAAGPPWPGLEITFLFIFRLATTATYQNINKGWDKKVKGDNNFFLSSCKAKFNQFNLYFSMLSKMSFLQIFKIQIFLNFPISKFPSLKAEIFSTPSPVSQGAGSRDTSNLN